MDGNAATRSKTSLPYRYQSNSISSQHQQAAAAAKCKSYFHILIKFNCPVRHEIKYVSPGNCKIAWMNADHRCSVLHAVCIRGRVCEEAGVSLENLSRQVSQHSFMNSLKSESFLMQCVRYYLTMFTRIFNRIIKMNNSNNILYIVRVGVASHTMRFL